MAGRAPEQSGSGAAAAGRRVRTRRVGGPRALVVGARVHVPVVGVQFVEVARVAHSDALADVPLAAADLTSRPVRRVSVEHEARAALLPDLLERLLEQRLLPVII